MLSKNKAKEMKRRASQRRATHKAHRAALTLRMETRMAAAAKAEKTQDEGRVQRPRQINRESKQAQVPVRGGSECFR